MLLGIDFGTTRTLVCAVDRGNYPVVTFTDEVGDAHDHLPSIVADTPGGLVYGLEAVQAGRDGAPVLRSFKRALAAADVTGSTPLVVGERASTVLEVLVGYLSSVRTALLTTSSLAGELPDRPRVVIGVPAHAHGAQRFLTLEAFRRAGFEVIAMINEPSAAGFEYTHRHRRTISANRRRVLVYDLGGGTFDASLVSVDGTDHEVLGSVGINDLGGDDFDTVLADLALATAGVDRVGLGTRRAYAELCEEAREAKERLTPQSKRLLVEVAGSPVTVGVDAFYEAATPLVSRTIEAMATLVPGGEDDLAAIAGVYVVGGASSLPLVPRRLREPYARRVHVSPYPAASTAIGLAIAADPDAGYHLTERLSRGFGVFREGRSGAQVRFDPLLSRDERVSVTSSVSVTRRYRAAHNVGWFRFVEHADVDEQGEPRGDLMPFAEVVFPFDPALQQAATRGEDLREVEVSRREHGPLVEEQYLVDRHGLIEVRLTDLDTGYTQTHRLTTP